MTFFNYIAFFLFTFVIVSLAPLRLEAHTGLSPNLTLSDLYAFREDWQSSGASSGNMILIMNSLPGAIPMQQYFFNPSARYEFHLSRVGTGSQKAVAPTGSDDIVIQFQFSGADTNVADTAYNTQSMAVTTFRDGVTDGTVTTNTDNSAILSTSLVNSQLSALTINNFMIGGSQMTVFAGLRQDPRFFDIVHFFDLKGSLVASNGTSASPGFASSPTIAGDSSTGYNVNTIVLRVPISFLQSNGETVFDVWETVLVPR
jgi:hypothetical protein